MIDIKYLFGRKFQLEELGKSRKHGCALACPGVTGGKSYTPEQLNTIQSEANISFPPSLIDFYTQVAELNVYWEIAEHNDGIKKDDSAQFKEDPWLKKNYYDQGYTWGGVKILLSGKMTIANISDLLDKNQLIETGIYDKASKFGLEDGALRPIDFNEFATACMKVEDGKLIDNIYLYTGFGGYPEALHDMKIGFEKYLDLAYKAKCFNYWNLAYCLRDKVPTYELMKRYLPKLFPHLSFDLEEFGIKY